MMKVYKIGLVSIMALLIISGVGVFPYAYAATAPPLGTTSTFAILAGSTVTNVGATVVTGDMGISPGTSCTGFVESVCTPGLGIVTGTIYLGPLSLAATAQADLTTAYNYVAAGGSEGTATTIPTELGGQTLAPGVYNSAAGTFTLTAGVLTLNGAGVYVFQMLTTLTTSAGGSIAGSGAIASNIFWQVGSSATIGASSVFLGTILAQTSIGLAGGDTVTGRLLARTGAVTIAGASTITAPTSGTGGNAGSANRMTGGGNIATAATGKVTIGLELHCNVAALPNNFEVNWKGNQFHLDTLNTASCTTDPSISSTPPVAGFNTMTGTGTGSYNGASGATISFTLKDGGEPGRSDSVSLTIMSGTTTVLSVSGTLSGGNIQAHS